MHVGEKGNQATLQEAETRSRSKAGTTHQLALRDPKILDASTLLASKGSRVSRSTTAPSK